MEEEAGYISIKPDGLLSAAFNAAKRLSDGGVFMLDTLNESEFTKFAMELFRALVQEAALIDKSSWLPHNQRKAAALGTLAECAANKDTEVAHALADEALLTLIGDEDISAAFNDLNRWYA